MPALSQAELCRLLGISPQRLNWHRKNKTAEAPKTYDLALWREYFAAHGFPVTAPNAGDEEGKTLNQLLAEKKLAILEETRAERSRRNRVADNLIFEAGEVNQFVTNLVRYFFAELDRLAAEYPVTLKGKAEIPINEECVRQNKSIKNALRDKVAEWDRVHQAKNPS